ncbi:MAG TPA: AI-2E family transporter [Edaphobacter sp.]|jgi:predicted PurR-regulated permease PerM|nr:AI-2E family transporter [Edaphobacter sp.]
MQMDLQQPAQHNVPKNLWKQIALFLLTLGVIGVCLLILWPFLSGIIGAIVLAVITQRPYNWLTHRIRNRNVSAGIALILVILSVIIPSFFVVQDLLQGTSTVVIFLRSDVPQRTLTGLIIRHPTLAADIQAVSSNFDLPNTIRAAAAFLGSVLASFLGYSFGAITQIVIMLFILFFLYRDQEQAISFARSLLPLNEEQNNELLENIRSTIHATALGRLVIAVIQAVLAGIAFWLLGVPNTMLWTVVTGLVAILPAVGTSLVWIPIALYLGFSGYLGKAALLTVWGTFVVSSIDNFLYPVLVGSKLQQHTVGILLAILGGVVVFGLSGVILGPLAFTVATTLLNFWRRRDTDLHPNVSQ